MLLVMYASNPAILLAKWAGAEKKTRHSPATEKL
jgi:hypothetical protein